MTSVHSNVSLVKKLGILMACFMVILLISTAKASQRERVFDEQRYFAFTAHLLAFHEKMTGCHTEQRGGRPGEEKLVAMWCDVGGGGFDARDWNKLSEEGAKLFGAK